MWPHSSRCCVHGQDQPLVQIIYKYDAAVFPLLHLTLVASNNVLLVVILSLPDPPMLSNTDFQK